MTKAYAEFGKLVDAIILPDGYRFHEWTPGNTIAPVPVTVENPTAQYYDTYMAALEGPNGKYVPFEISYLARTPKMERGLLYIGVAELAQAVDKAIEKLEAQG